MQQRNFVINNGLAGVFKQTIPLKLSTTVVQLNHRLANECTMHFSNCTASTLFILLVQTKNANMHQFNKILLGVAYPVECQAHFME
jgi:hypothetical protein